VNVFFLFGALAATALALGHPFFGETLFFKDVKFRGSYWGDEDITWRLTLGGWHLLTVALIATAVQLYALAFTHVFEHPREIAWLITLQYIGFTAVVAFYALGRPFILVRAPLWILTGGVALFSWLGASRL
jgi:hypothetical protein